MNLRLVPLVGYSDVRVCADMLYLGSFPESERAPLDSLHEFADSGRAGYYALMDDDFRGLAYVVPGDELVFLLYLAVSPSSRGMGYGSAALDAVKGICGGRRLFLNVEPVGEGDNLRQRERRRDFYIANGFTEHGPVTTPDGERYTMMCFGGDVSDDEAMRFYLSIGSEDLFGTAYDG